MRSLIAALLLGPIACPAGSLAGAGPGAIEVEEETDEVRLRIVREPGHLREPPPPDTSMVLRGSRTRGGQIAVHAARQWLMEHGMRIVERRAGAEQLVIVEYSHPLEVHVRGVDRESGEVRWMGQARAEGNLEELDGSLLREITRQALRGAWGLP